jgi:EAL and modified HD-GYP domain-containing signal transduction protein
MSVSNHDVAELSKEVSAIANAAPDTELVVGDIHFFEELQVCRQLQVHLLQGSYLRRKDVSAVDAVDASYLRLLEVLNLVRSEAEPVVIANAMKYDPMLSFKLLRYVNSPGAGLVAKVETLDRAMIVLGNKQLYRWLTLLMFSHERQDADHSLLLETALIRGRMMETLGARQFKRDELDQLFTTGMFSMLDALLRQPMSQILDKLNLPPDITQALLDHSGKFGPLLSLALACEDGDLPDQPELFSAAGVSKNEANKAQIEAMLWVEEVV